MKSREQFEKSIHYIMSLVGGFIGAYALLNRCEVFGSSQTSNMIHVIINLLRTNPIEMIIRLTAVLIYAAGIMITVLIPKYTKLNIYLVSVILDILVLIVIGIFPKDMNNIIALYPVFFITAIQWNAFKGVNGYNCSTIFSTNNLRQAVMSLTEFICDGDKTHLVKTKFYGGILLHYHFGVVVSYFSYKLLGIQSSWVCIIPLTIALALVCSGNQELKLNIKDLLRIFMGNY